MAMKEFNVGIKAVVEKDGKFLVVYNPRGFWDWPGGRIDDDESIEETLIREISEELPSSRDVKIGSIVAAYRKQKFTVENPMALVLIMYRVELNFENEDNIAISGEHHEYRWVTKDEALELESELVSETMKAL